MQMLRATVIAAAMLLSQVAAAADATPVIQAVEAKYKDVGAMKANFVQTTRSDVFGSETQKGDVTLKRPSKMRWNFEGAKVFVTDGKTMWIYTRDDNQVIKYDDVSSTGGSAADSLLQSLDKLSEVFEVELIESTDAQHVLGLTPKSAEAKNQVKKVRMKLSSEYVVQHVAITDPFDNVTELTFSAVQLGVDVPDATFQFQVPEGAEVVSAG